MGKKKYAMVIDLDKCLGCKTCTIACNTENSVSNPDTWNVVLDSIEGKYPDYERSFLPRPCMHCEKPPCVDACPTGASFEKEELGIVLVNHKRCIGCRSCMTSCPYEARVFNWKRPERLLTENPVVPTRRIGVVEKCTFCIQRVEEGLAEGKQVGTTVTERDNQKVITPACVDQCIGNARYFGDLNDPDSEVSELIKKNEYKILAEEAGTEPNVYYLGYRKSENKK